MLSEADIRVLALTYALEVEQNGLRRIRPAPGKLSPEEQEREDKKKERLAKLEAERKVKQSEKQMENLSLQSSEVEEEPEASTSTLPPAEGQDNKPKDEEAVEVDTDAQGFQEVPSTQKDDEEVDEGAGEDDESDGDGEWITPTNVTLHKSRDLGLFPSIPAHHPDALVPKSEKKPKQKTILKVACLTGDFAMQNVALQMGLNVFGVGGQKIKEVKTWVLRCHACFK